MKKIKASKKLRTSSLSIMSYNSGGDEEVKKRKVTVDVNNIKIDEKVICTASRLETDEEKKARVEKEQADKKKAPPKKG